MKLKPTLNIVRKNLFKRNTILWIIYEAYNQPSKHSFVKSGMEHDQATAFVTSQVQIMSLVFC